MTAPLPSSAPHAGGDRQVDFGQPSSGRPHVPGFGRGGALAGVVVVAVLVGGLIWSAAAGQTAWAKHPHLFGGSLVLEDYRPLTVIDVATGQVTVRLQGVYSQVGATSFSEVEAVPVSAGTMLVNDKSGTFNLLGKDNYVLDAAGPGVGLGALPGSTGAGALATSTGAYIVRYGRSSTVSLVDEATVLQGAKLEGAGTSGTASAAGAAPGGRSAPAVTPRGFASAGGAVLDQPGSAAVASGDLWALVGSAGGCRVEQFHPVPAGHNGLVPTARVTLPTSCAGAAVEALGTTVGVVSSGQVRLFPPGSTGSGRDIAVPGVASATRFLPVTGASGALWYLVLSPQGWSVFGVTTQGKTTGPSALHNLGPSALPVTPVESGGYLYTLDQAAAGQPTLWTIDPATGGMAPVAAAATYPARSPTERASFRGAQVLVDGPRVVFNNPESLLAVVVFTDGSNAPVIVDKSEAVEVSATGPADLNAALKPKPSKSSTPTTTPPQGRPAPVVQPVSQQVTCANTTQKPYAPQITSIVPSSGTAIVAWSYQLLDQTDCEPDSWSVDVTALSGSYQPAQPIQVVNGQNQMTFTGLRPSTTYQAVVTAYINAQSTPSTPATFTTAARGPDAPVSVQTASDGQGNWVVSWTPCTTPDCIVPADNWNVVGTACGSSYVGQPPSVQVPGTQTSATVNADSLGLLGDSVSFSVQGVLVSGLPGNPTSDHTCTEAWRAPNAADIALQGAGTASGQTITASLQVSTNGPTVEAFGSQSTDFVYHVGDATVGPTTATSVTVPGLAAGQSYTPTVTVYPAGHPSSSVTVTGAAFSQTLTWPPGLAVDVAPSVDPTNPNIGSLDLAFPGRPPGPMTAAGTVTCGSTQQPIGGPLSNGTLAVSDFNLDTVGGACDLSVTLSDTANPDPYGVSSPPLAAHFSIGTQPNYGFSSNFTQQCQKFCLQEQIIVGYGGPGQDPPAGDTWMVCVDSAHGQGGNSNGNGTNPCAQDQTDLCQVIGGPTANPAFPVTVALPLTCPDAKQVDVQVSWRYLGVVLYLDLGRPGGTPGTTTTTTTTTTPPTTVSKTSTTTTKAAPTAGASPTHASAAPATQLAAAAGPAPTVPGDPAVRDALEWVLVLLGAAWFAGSARGLRRRRARKGHR
ncbi:MAG: fibronectin type III domain-containing protein [Acidimicrobiales bacterium]